MIIISHKPQLKIFQLSQMESMPLVGTNVGMEKKKFSQILFLIKVVKYLFSKRHLMVTFLTQVSINRTIANNKIFLTMYIP